MSIRTILRYAAVPAALALALGMAACGSTAVQHHAAATTHTAAPSGPAPVTCAQLGNDFATVVADQKSQDKALEENWVNLTDGSPTSQGNDLQALTSDAGFPAGATPPDQVTADFVALSNDASTFFSDQSGGLLPGWTAEYNAIKHDIYAVATDCGVPH